MGKAVSALRVQQKNICGCTNLECASCTPGPCEHRKHPNAPLTNADRIRAMSDEELVEFIHEPFCDKRTHEECTISYCGVCSQCILDWLQQPAEETDHGI